MAATRGFPDWVVLVARYQLSGLLVEVNPRGFSFYAIPENEKITQDSAACSEQRFHVPGVCFSRNAILLPDNRYGTISRQITVPRATSMGFSCMGSDCALQVDIDTELQTMVFIADIKASMHLAT